MQKIRYTLRFNRKKQLNKNGRASIQIECYLNGLRKYFDTKIKVTPSQWHEKTKTIKDTPNAIQQNSIIKEMIRELESYEIGLINAGKVCTLDMLENAFAYQNNNTFNVLVGSYGVSVTVRKEMGDAIQAACGQLKAAHGRKKENHE